MAYAPVIAANSVQLEQAEWVFDTDGIAETGGTHSFERNSHARMLANGSWLRFEANEICQSEGVGAYMQRTVPPVTYGMPNSAGIGAVAGSPGVPPTEWSTFAATALGLNRQSVAVGTWRGLRMITLRSVNNADTGSPQTGGLAYYFKNGATRRFPVIAGQQYTAWMFANITAHSGSLLNNAGLQMRIVWRDGANAEIAYSILSFDPTSWTDLQLVTVTGVAPANAEWAEVILRFGGSAGVHYDWEMSVVEPQINRGPVPLTPFGTTNANDDLAGSILTLSLNTPVKSNWYVQYDNENVGLLAEEFEGSLEITPESLARPIFKRIWTEPIGGEPEPQDIQLSSIVSVNVFGQPLIERGVVQVAPPSIGSSAAFGDLLIKAGSVQIAPPSISPTSTVPEPTLSAGVRNLAPPSIAPTSGLGEPSISVGATEITLDGIESESTVGAPLVSYQIGMVGIGPTSVVNNPDVRHAVSYFALVDGVWRAFVLRVRVGDQWVERPVKQWTGSEWSTR